MLSYPPLASHGLLELLPGPVVVSAPDLEAYVRCGPALFKESRQECKMDQLPANHLAGTCKLGSEDQPDSARARRRRGSARRAPRARCAPAL